MTEESIERPHKNRISENNSILDRQLMLEARRTNLIMLTQQRGSKNQLAALSGTTPSRISLMASGRKPVSDPFARGIERGLNVPDGWLDIAHVTTEVSDSIWNLLTLNGYKIEERNKPRSSVGRSSLNTNRKENNVVRTNETPDNKTTRNVNSSTLFIKTEGEVGPIAEALSKTVLKFSADDRLSEERAFQLLGMLLEAKD